MNGLKQIDKSKFAFDILEEKRPHLLPYLPKYDIARITELGADKYSTIYVDACRYPIPDQYAGEFISAKGKATMAKRTRMTTPFRLLLGDFSIKTWECGHVSIDKYKWLWGKPLIHNLSLFLRFHGVLRHLYCNENITGETVTKQCVKPLHPSNNPALSLGHQTKWDKRIKPIVAAVF